MTTTAHPPVLVLGGTGTIGHRVVAQLLDRGLPARAASRHTDPPLNWADPTTWDAALDGAERIYLLLPDDVDLPDGFLDRARAAGVRRVVLHSDRAVDLMNVTRLQGAERAVRASGLEWTIIRPDWFAQNFETFFRDGIVGGRLCMPVGEAKQGFVDGDDIAAVAVKALTTDAHLGEVLEITGPTALSFREATALIADAIGRPVEFDGTPQAYREQMLAVGLPEEAVEGLIQSFAPVAEAGDTHPTGVVEAVLGRPARPFADYVAAAAARGVWQ
ncbi:NAD(P)H-binding protein [Georgenia faecalis]|uniref:NAD(P)H-binding protein n=1 Tax=Georgenia faecalis TaxID=2483799 RepID=A0ABV9D7D4_9MICO|nr:NAD(P)H-binding protein [Georgenia faecalis]